MNSALFSWLLLALASGCQGGVPMQGEKPLFDRDLDELLSGECRDLAKSAAAGDVKRMSQLLTGGLDVDCKGYRGITPLYWAIAARRTNRAGLEALLSAGADPNLSVFDGTPLIHFAAMRDEPWILETVLRHGGNPDAVEAHGGTTPLFSTENHSTVVTLVNAGANIDYSSKYGRRPLSALASANQYESVYLLLQQGADWQIQEFITITRNIASTWDTRSPQYAWYLKTVDFLRARGVDI